MGSACLSTDPRARRRARGDARWRRPAADRAEPAVSGGHRTRVPRLRGLVLPLAHRVGDGVRFYSDNTATACPEILAAIIEANQGLPAALRAPPWTQRLDAVLGGIFRAEVRALAVAAGTAAH